MIFYFSATGNTKWAAEQLAAATGEQLYSISELIKADHYVFHLQETERIGFCFPVHGWRPPMPVRDFLTRIKIANATGHFCFALCTAGDTIGETIRILQQDLAVAGLHAEGLYSLLMPNTYVGLPFMTVDSKETAHRKLKVAAEEISRYVTDIVNRRAGSRLHVGRWPRINSRWLGEWFVRNALTDRPFRVNNERCIRCGRCATVCPMQNITGGKGEKPIWHHTDDCISCFACYHGCPVHAIDYGHRTRKKGQYYYGRKD